MLMLLKFSAQKICILWNCKKKSQNSRPQIKILRKFKQDMKFNAHIENSNLSQIEKKKD